MAALLIGGGAPAAFAACANNINASFDNPLASTTPCVAVTNTSFTGNITNEGTIAPGGITFNNGTITGFITSSGNIAGGISLDSASAITAAGTAISITGPTFLGGISNAGTISATAAAIIVDGVTSFAGGISNSGTISAFTGIAVNNVANFAGGISNSGSIFASNNGIAVSGGSIFNGGISNSGTISAFTGISVVGVPTFLGGIANSGTISAIATGIHVCDCVTTFLGGITNSGLIQASGFGISVSASTFGGGISNSGTISARLGIFVSGVRIFGTSTAGGGIVNSGTIAAGSTAIVVTSVRTFLGGITNQGLIVGSGAGIVVGGPPGGGVSVFNGGIVNQGTILLSGFGFFNTGIAVAGVSTFLGGISNSGTISQTGFTGVGILVSDVRTFTGGIANSGTIAGFVTGIDVCNCVTTFLGGITNSGLIAASSVGISVGVRSFGGGISNSGTILAGSAGIVVAGVRNFDGGIANSGTISALFATGIQISDVSTFSGGVSNSGTIFARASGIVVGTTLGLAPVTTFLGGIANSGLIAASGGGISVTAASIFAGGIGNSGTISAQFGDGVLAFGVGTFSGGISNGGTISAQGIGPPGFVGAGIAVMSVSLFGSSSAGGGITNSGMIAADFTGVLVQGVGSFFGGIANSGTITAGFAGIQVGNFGTTSSFGGGISNGGLIAIANPGSSYGITIDNVSLFTGGVHNSGTITGAGIGIALGFCGCGIETFSGGITNTGSISANVGIFVGTVGTFDGHIVNTGTITAVTAIDLSSATGAITIDQNGGLLAGDVLFSVNGDTLFVRGGTINGNIVGQNAGDTINFTLGASTFTYAAAYGFTNVSQVNVNSGIVILDGANSATNTAVNGGVLQVGDAANTGATLTSTVDVIGGVLAGHGTVIGDVTIENGGVLAPGGSIGTLTISGSLTFNAGSFYAVQIAPGAGNNSATVVNGVPGIATINGGTVVVTPQAGRYDATNYIIVATTGGVGGTFTGGVKVNGIFSGTMTLDYTTIPGDVLLDISAGATLFTGQGLNQNQQNVLNGLNNAIIAGSNLPPGFQNLALLTGPQFANALTQLSGEAGAGFLQGAFQSGDLFLNLMVNPFLDGRFGSGGGFGAAMGFAAEAPPALPQAAAAFASAMPVKAPPYGITTSASAAYRAWGSAFGGAESVDGNAAVGSHTTTSRAFGFAAGVDYPIAPMTTLGFALAGGGTNWGLEGGLGGGHSDMFQAGAYASHRWGQAYVSGALSYNFHDVTTDRTVTVAGVDRLSASFQAHGIGARLEGGYRYATPWLGITPYGAVQVQSIFLPGYGETATAGSNQFALNYASQTATATRSELGAWFDRSTLLSNGALLTVYGRAAWAHDFGNTPAASAIFQALPGSNFVVNGAAPARDGALVTAGALYRLMNGWSLQAKFDGEFSSTTNVYSGTGVVKKTW